MSEPKLPAGALGAAMDRLARAGEVDDGTRGRRRARIALEGALPRIQRGARRELARELLARTEGMDFHDTCYEWRSCLRRLARGEALPDVPPQEGTTDGEVR